MYRALLGAEAIPYDTLIWKLKLLLTSVHNLFTGWLDGINRKLKSKILVGASAIYWVNWLTRNDIVFDKIPASSYLQVIFRGLTGSGFGPYYRRKRIAKWWRWVAGILRQPRWRCLQDTVGDLAIELFGRCRLWKLFLFPLWLKTLFLRLRGP
jgi:hypothetical protein